MSSRARSNPLLAGQTSSFGTVQRDLQPLARWGRRWQLDSPGHCSATVGAFKERRPGSSATWSAWRRPLANLRRQGRLDDDTLGWVKVLAAIVDDVDAMPQAVEEARAVALRQPRVLAPVGADPMRESLTQFLRRATNHWCARTVERGHPRASAWSDLQGGLRQSRAVAAYPMARTLPGPQGIV